MSHNEERGTASEFVKMMATANSDHMVFPFTLGAESDAVLRASKTTLNAAAHGPGTNNVVIVLYPNNPLCPAIGGWFENIAGVNRFVPDSYARPLNSVANARTAEGVALTATGVLTNPDLTNGGSYDIAYYPPALNPCWLSTDTIAGMPEARSGVPASKAFWARAMPLARATPQALQGSAAPSTAIARVSGDAVARSREGVVPTGSGTILMTYDFDWSLDSLPLGNGCDVDVRCVFTTSNATVVTMTLRPLVRGTGGTLIVQTDPGASASPTRVFNSAAAGQYDTGVRGILQSVRPFCGVRLIVSAAAGTVTQAVNSNAVCTLISPASDSNQYKGAVVAVYNALAAGSNVAVGTQAVVKYVFDPTGVATDGTPPQPTAHLEDALAYNRLIDRGFIRAYGIEGDDDAASPERAEELSDAAVWRAADTAWYNDLGRIAGSVARFGGRAYRAASQADRYLGGAISDLIPPAVRDPARRVMRAPLAREAYRAVARLSDVPIAECARVQRWACPLQHCPPPIVFDAIYVFDGTNCMLYSMDDHPAEGQPVWTHDGHVVAALAHMADAPAGFQLQPGRTAEHAIVRVPAAIRTGEAANSGGTFLYAVASLHPLPGVQYAQYQGAHFATDLLDAARGPCAAVAKLTRPYKARYFAVLSDSPVKIQGGSFSLGLYAAASGLSTKNAYSGELRADGAIARVGAADEKLAAADATKVLLLANLDGQQDSSQYYLPVSAIDQLPGYRAPKPAAGAKQAAAPAAKKAKPAAQPPREPAQRAAPMSAEQLPLGTALQLMRLITAIRRS